MNINSITGQIFGIPNQAGDFPVQVTVRDDEASSSALFTLTVSAENSNGGSSDSGGGSMSLITLFLFLQMVFIRRLFRVNRNA